MPLTIGARLGPYQIAAAIGAGGMGEVFRARDTKLQRDVAIKVLPQAFALDPDRLARFAREAQVLASLNHPNIAAIYGREESEGMQALVLELVDGPTLADRIARGPVPLDEALPIVRQIAVALEAAHGLGIVHRDLKPANIKLRTDGTVKVLDFGLAKTVDPVSTAIDASMSPTITSPAMTRMGVILGTAAYMSPEQAKGRPADKRSDVWAFGCVLYELLTGARAFQGDDATETIAAVVRAEPDWSKLPVDTPPSIRRLLRRAMTKAHADRLADIADARLEIDEARGAAVDASVRVARSGAPRWTVAAAFVAGVVLTAIVLRTALPGPAPPAAAVGGAVLRTTIDLPKNAPLALGSEIPALGYDSPVVALSPDGGWLAYVARTPSGRMLYLREMASGEIRLMPGTEGVVHPFFSPDGQWVGFLTADHVKKTARQGGTVISLCEAEQPVLAWWLDPQTIFFTEVETTALSKVAADGGKRERLASSSDLKVIGFDSVLPGGRTVLARRATGISADYGDIVRIDLGTKETRVLVRSGYAARYVAPGYLVFARSGNLMAVRFDAERGEVVGEPATVAAGVSMESLFGMLHASSSNAGVLTFVAGADLSVGKLAWIDRRGSVEYLDVPERVYGVLDLSPDGTRVAVHVADVKDYNWIWDFARREGRRVSNASAEGFPAWSRDGRRLAGNAFENMLDGRVLVHDVEPGGAVGAGVELKGAGNGVSTWSPRGDVIALNLFPSGRIEFFGVDKPVTVAPFVGGFPAFSPDGRWIVHASTADEVLIRSYPEGKVFGQVSTGTGNEPRWKPSGDLYYRVGRRWFLTRVTTSPEPKWDPPKLVFDTEFIDTPGMSYDVSPDGQRLMVVKRTRPVIDSRIEIISNWPALVDARR